MADPKPKEGPVNTGSPKKPDYKYLWETCEIDKDKIKSIEAIVKKISANRVMYELIGEALNNAWWITGLLHYRESSKLTLDVYLHNGQKLGVYTTIHPKGLFFRKDQFFDAAVDALRKKKIKNIRTPAQFLELAEKYNGLGYRTKIGDKGKVEYSPYIWAGTNHSDETGKYVADGKYDPKAVDRQIGVAAVLKGILKK